MAENIINATDASFDADVLKSDKPVLVDFWASWCGPCKAIAPVIDEIAAEYGGKMTVAKVDVDSNQKTPAQYGIRSIPTLIIFKNGQIAAQHSGALNKMKLKEFIDRNV